MGQVCWEEFWTHGMSCNGVSAKEPCSSCFVPEDDLLFGIAWEIFTPCVVGQNHFIQD
jgi:hypothetical protein